MDIVINEAEQGALQACSLEAGRLYLHLRPLMSIATGLVGVATKVSYGRLALDIQYAPPQGSTRAPWVPSRDKVINLVDELVRVGLLKRYSMKDQKDKKLVLLLALAYRGQTRPDYEGHVRATPDGHSQSQTARSFAANDDHGVASGEGDISEYRRTSSILSSSSVVPAAVMQKALSIEEDENVMRDKPTSPTAWMLIMKTLAYGPNAETAEALAIYGRWVAMGLTMGELLATNKVSRKSGGRSVKYVDTVLRDIRERQAGMGEVPVAVKPGRPWYMSADGIERKGAELGVGQLENEPFPYFRMRVYQAAGLTEQEWKIAQCDLHA